MSEAAATDAPAAPTTAAVKGMKKNGKQWHDNKSAFRPRANQTSWDKRTAERKALAAIKAKEKELKDEKAATKQAQVDRIREKRAAKEERERFQKMEEKMHKKRVERLKRREKRNAMLKSGIEATISGAENHQIWWRQPDIEIVSPDDTFEYYKYDNYKEIYGIFVMAHVLRIALLATGEHVSDCIALAWLSSGSSDAAAALAPLQAPSSPQHHSVHMDNLYLHSGYSRPLRPNTYDRSSRPSIRVSSDPDSSSRRPHLHKHKSSHQHHHHHDEHRRHSSTRHHAKEVVQSALQPPTSFGDLLKQARGSKDSSRSRSHSRSRQQSPSRGNSGEQQKRGTDVGLTIPPPRPLRSEEIEREARRVEARERDLRTALQTLSDQSLRTSRRLDDTYYSILEKVSTLRQTIGTLQDLSGLTRELHSNFETDAQDLLDDVKGQFESSDKFDTQQSQIAALEQRITAGKEKADSLTARLVKAKEKVDRRVKSEAQWEASTNRWWQWFGGIVVSFTSLIIVLVVLHHLKPTHVEMDPKPTLHPTVKAKVLEAPIPQMAKDDILELATSTPSIRPLVMPSSKSSAGLDDRLLRRFDEL